METESKMHNIRHSLAHLLAMAALEHDPKAKLTLGPAIENGFYYDIEFSEDKNPSPADLKRFQKHMKKLAGRGLPFTGQKVSADEARTIFADNPFKLELIDEIEKRGEQITLYTTGDFTDLCRGGHVESTSEIHTDAFMLDRIAGAYWRGDEKNPMLTRIYGLAFETKEELDAYLTQREEAKKRDHRKLGKELDLFTFSDLVGPGLPLWTPKGTIMRDAIMDKIQTLQKEYGYQRVTIPHITKKDLYETSGHWQKFGDELFKVRGKQDTEFVMKPMNCPHHTQIYASRPRSYRDLPVRFIETTMVYRDEQAGELLGISRVRSITQDDGHVFCTPDQIESEIRNIISVIRSFYTSLGMLNENECWISVSVRDPETPDKYLGDDTQWDRAEKTLETLAEEIGFSYQLMPGEASFYGPKIDFMFKDALGREWQLATIQLDFVMPGRFGLEYTDESGEKRTPVMIHRAIAGSLERFLAVMIEHFAGAFPLWLSPVQVHVLPIAEAHAEYARKVTEDLTNVGMRAELHDENESLGKKIRNAKLAKVPYFLVIGDKEQETETVTIESRDRGNEGSFSLNDLLQKFQAEIDKQA